MDGSVDPAAWGATPASAAPQPAPDSPDAWGAKPASDAPAVRSEPAAPAKGFWENLTAPGFWKETTPYAIATRIGDVNSANQEFNRNGEWVKELDRRKAAGEPVTGMQQWKDKRLTEIIKASKGPQGPEPGFGEIFHAMKDRAVDDPMGMLGSLVRGIVATPEIAFLPEALPARMAEIVASAGRGAQVAARTAAEAAQVGGVVAGESALKQLVEKGEVNPNQVMADAIMVAAPVVAIKSGVAALKVLGKDVSQTKVASEAAKEVRKGTDPTDAALKVLKDYGLDKDTAEQIKDSVTVEPPKVEAKGGPDAAQERQVEKSGEQQHPRDEAQRLPAEPSRGGEPETGGKAAPTPEAGQVKLGDWYITPDGKAKLAETMRSEIGWAQRGGEIIRAQQSVDDAVRGLGGEGEVVGRTKWIPRSEFWPDRPKKDISEREAHGALDKALKGEKLKPNEQRFVDYAAAEALKRSASYLDPFQEGKIDPTLLASMGLAGATAATTYALTKEPDKTIGYAVAAGLLPFARNIAQKVGQSAGRIGKLFADKRIDPKQVWHDFYENWKVPEYTNRQWKKSMDALLPKEGRDEANVRIRDYLQGHRDVQLTPVEQTAADITRKMLDRSFAHANDAGVIESYLENYLPGIYQKRPFESWSDIISKLQTEEKRLQNVPGMRRTTRHALEKVIPDYRTVEQLVKDKKIDLIPLTNNPFEMARIAMNSVNKAVQVNKMVESLRALKDATGTPLVIGHSPIVTARTIREAIDRAGNDLGATQRVRDLWAEMELQRTTKDYVDINHPSLRGLKVHKDLAGPLKMLFDTSDPNGISNAVYAASMAHKSMLFTMSLFHASTLAAVGAPLAAGRAASMVAVGLRPGVVRSLRAAWDANAGKELSPVAQHMIATGTTLGSKGVQDVDPAFLQRVFNFAQSEVGKIPGAGKYIAAGLAAPKFAHQWVHDFIFEKLQPTFKMATWMADDALWRKKHPDATPQQLETAHRQLSDGVNTLYGGQNWFELANNVEPRVARSLASMIFSPSGRRFQQIAMLAPDWNISALRAWTEGAKAFNPMMGEKASDGLYRTYLVASGLLYLGMADMASQHYTGRHIWDTDDWTVVDRGDGTYIHLNKHFMEAMHLLQDPMKFGISKLNWLPKETLDQLEHKEYTTAKDDKIVGPAMQESRLAHALKSFFTPIAISQNPEQLVAGNLGMQIGGKSYQQQAQEKKERADAKAARPQEEKDKEKAATAKRAKDRAERQRKIREAGAQP